MTGERSHGIYVPPSTAPELDAMAIETTKQVHRRRVRIGVFAASFILACLGGLGIYDNEQDINRSSQEMSKLVKALGYTGAEAYKPTEHNTAYITLHAPGCTAGDPDLAIDVIAQLQDDQNGPEIAYFSRKKGEEKVDGEWRDIVENWRKPAELCALFASE